MMTKQTEYLIAVDGLDKNCLTLTGQEVWPDLGTSPPKTMGEIIINAANRSIIPGPNGEEPMNPGGDYISDFNRPLWVEPRHPKPNIRPEDADDES